MIFCPKKVYGFGEMVCLCWVPLEHCPLGHYWDLGKKARSTGIFSLCTWRSCLVNWCHSLTKLPRLSSIMLSVYVTSHMIVVSLLLLELSTEKGGVCNFVTFNAGCLYHVVWLMIFLFIGTFRNSRHATCFYSTHWVPKARNIFCASATHIVMGQWTCFWFVFIWIGCLQGQVVFSLLPSCK